MTTFEVINNNDNGEGSFRQAILNVNSSPVGNDYIINFTSTFNITIISTYPTISRSVTINGNNSILVNNNNNTKFFTINTSNLNVTINNFIMRNNTTQLISSLINSISTNLTFIDCRISSSVDIIINSLTTSFVNIINVIDGTLNIISTYDGGFSIFNFNFSILSILGPPPSYKLIYTDNCPLVISGEFKSIISDIKVTSPFSDFTNIGSIIYSNSNVNIKNLVIDRFLNESLTSNSSITNIINFYNTTSVNVTFDTCEFTNIGMNGFSNKVSSVILANNIISINMIDCIINNIYANYFILANNNCTLKIDSINRDSVLSSLISTRFYYNNYVSKINIGDDSNYNIVFEDFTGAITGTDSRVLRMNDVDDNSTFKNCIFRNIVGNIYNCIQINRILGRIDIDNCSFTSIETISQVINILNSSSQLNQVYFTNNIFENIVGGVMSISNDCSLYHGNNNINNELSTSQGTLILLRNVNVNYVGPTPTLITNTLAIGIRVDNSTTVEKNIPFFTFINCRNSTTIFVVQTNDESSVLVSNCQFDSCNSAFTINNLSTSTAYSIISNSTFTNAGNNNGVNINCSNALIKVLNCDFTSSSQDIVTGYVIRTNRNVEMTNGTILLNGDYTIISNAIQVNDSELIINNYNISTKGNNVIRSNSCIANYCNFTYNGNIYENQICINTNVYKLNGVTINGFITGINSLSSVEGEKLIISNSTLSGNSTGLNTNNTDIINCTIMNNDIGVFVRYNGNRIVNSLIANNEDNVFVTDGSTITSLGNNATDIDTTSTFTQPTDIISPLVLENIGPLENNGGIPETYALLNNNICLGKGNVEYAVSSYDNRGEGYNRVVDGNVDIGSYENQNPIVCFTSDSEVLVDKNGVVCYECVRNVVAGDKVIVKDVGNGELKLSEVVHNVITGKRKWFIRIEKDGIDVDEPFRTTHFTGGHMLVIGGKEIKARDIVGKNDIRCSKVKLEEQDVHSFVLEDRSYINVNGVLNVAFGREEWYRLVKRMNIVWRDNMI